VERCRVYCPSWSLKFSPLPLSDGSADFAGQATALLDDFPNTRLAIYAEPHLLICSGTCSFDRMERLIATARA